MDKDHYQKMGQRSSQALRAKLGSDEAYRAHMSKLSKGRSKQKPDTVESLIRRIGVVAPTEGVEVEIKVRKL